MLKRILLALFICTAALPSHAEDGSRLWLRYDTVSVCPQIENDVESPTMRIAVDELSTFWHGGKVSLRLMADDKYYSVGKDGYTITAKDNVITLRSLSETGLLYAVYHLLRLQASGKDCSALDICEKPMNDIRILNHWDNPDGTIERGYAGRSLWKWDELPATLSPRYAEYARANASIGINGTVLNNVNASPDVLSSDNLKKIKALADLFRPYGIKVYLSVNFATPMKLGGLTTADPLDKQVADWWKMKVHEVYSTHTEGANMLASAMKPYGGIVMWRAFVYSPTDDDRAKQAYLEFKPLDGKFLDNVIVQVKNGPIDFQPREPYSPLFGAMPHTQLMVEFQVTQEYLGHSNHLAYLAPMWKEFYQYFPPSAMRAAAGVANIGDDTNWCGNDLAQSNWYAFGRLAWNPALTSQEIAEEWLAQTFTTDRRFLRPMTEVMLQSREAVVDYMMPLGLHHIFAWGHHYGPEPWCEIEGARPDWLPTYYHRADIEGLGFDRTTEGSDAVSQYPDSLAAVFNNIDTCPEEFILWFHHVPWKYEMKSGRTMWDELCMHYQHGVDAVRSFRDTWTAMSPYVDAERHAAVLHRFEIQASDAVWWKDACLEYFRTFSHMKYPKGVEKPHFSLKKLKKVNLPIDNYTCPSAEMLPGFKK